jgi:indole-3-glycerol phosphate synthase
LNQTNAIDVDNGDYGIISENHIQSGSASQILLDATSERNTVSVNNAGAHASAISVSTSSSQFNVKAGNQPPAVTT